MTTAARPTTEASCHWYDKLGNPVYEVPRSKGEGMRPTTLADARKLNLLPSVTTILSILRKPQLESWLVEQSVLAALTTPRLPDEPLDAFVERVLHTERVQDQESDIAKKRGTEIHDAIESYFKGEMDHESELWGWIAPTIKFLVGFGHAREVERILVSNDGYAGRTDLIQQKLNSNADHVWDFKTTRKLPTKESYPEHVLQCSAYANAYEYTINGAVQVTTGNIYISTVNKGEFAVFEHGMWIDAYNDGFRPLLQHWMWSTGYHP